jgi:hypothetical protein
MAGRDLLSGISREQIEREARDILNREQKRAAGGRNLLAGVDKKAIEREAAEILRREQQRTDKPKPKPAPAPVREDPAVGSLLGLGGPRKQAINVSPAAGLERDNSRPRDLTPESSERVRQASRAAQAVDQDNQLKAASRGELSVTMRGLGQPDNVIERIPFNLARTGGQVFGGLARGALALGDSFGGGDALGDSYIRDKLAGIARKGELLSSATIRGRNEWEDVKNNPLRLPGLIADELPGALAYSGSMLSPLGIGVIGGSFTGNIAQDRARNDGRLEADARDVAIAAPFAATSLAAEKLGTKYLFGGGDLTGNVATRIAKSGGIEGLTEMGQSLIEGLGGSVGTKRGVDVAELGDQMLAGLVIGTGTGGAIRAGSETVEAGAKKIAARRVARATITPEDEASPLNTRDIEAGRAAQIEAQVGQTEDSSIDLPAVGGEIDFFAPNVNGGARGIFKGTFQDDTGVGVELEVGGQTIREYVDNLRDAGFRISPVQSAVSGSTAAAPAAPTARPVAQQSAAGFNMDRYLARNAQVESSNNPNAKAATSSASGLFQFTKDTWIAEGGKWGNDPSKPFGGLTPSVQEQRARATSLTEKNAAAVKSAGAQLTDGNVYLAHFLGAGGARSVLKANPNTPVEQLLSEGQIAANKSILKGKTAGDVIAWAAQKMGGPLPSVPGGESFDGTEREPFEFSQQEEADAGEVGLIRKPIPLRVEDREETAVVPATLQEVPVRYAVAELEDLVPSNLPDGEVNPAFPAERQPRDRTRAASQNQVRNIATNLYPRLMGRDVKASDGAPIISADGVVDSGNGRVMALGQAYRAGGQQIEDYRAMLEAEGFDVSDMKQPVMVRVRGDMTPDEVSRFVRDSNARSTAVMSGVETAATDAASMGVNLLGLYRGGDLDTLANADFVRGFVQAFVPASEAGTMMMGDGRPSANLLKRIEAALLVRALGPQSFVEWLVDSRSSNIKSIGNALIEVSGRLAQMREAAAQGIIDPAVDISANIAEAVTIVDRARREERGVAEFVNQIDAFSGTIDPITEAVLRLMYKDPAFKKPRSQKSLTEALDFYIEQAMVTVPGGGLIESTSNPASDILGLANARQDDPTARPSAKPAAADGQIGSLVDPVQDVRPAGTDSGERAGEGLQPGAGTEGSSESQADLTDSRSDAVQREGEAEPVGPTAGDDASPSYRIEETPSGKGIAVFYASEAQREAVERLVPEAKASKRSDGAYTYSKKNRAVLENALEAMGGATETVTPAGKDDDAVRARLESALRGLNNEQGEQVARAMGLDPMGSETWGGFAKRIAADAYSLDVLEQEITRARAIGAPATSVAAMLAAANEDMPEGYRLAKDSQGDYVLMGPQGQISTKTGGKFGAAGLYDPTAFRKMASAAQERAREDAAKNTRTTAGKGVIGRNSDGNEVFEDENGVRSYVENGIRLTESVGLTPTRDGIRMSVDVANRWEVYKTVEELGQERAQKEQRIGREYDALENTMQRAQERLDAFGAAQAATYKSPGIKSRARVVEKVTNEGYTGVRDIKDLARAAFIVDSMAEADALAAAIGAEFIVSQDKGWKTLDSGYVDHKIIVNIQGVSAELQIVPSAIWNAKKAGGANKLYNEQRKPGITAERFAELEQQQQEIYGSALTGTDFAQFSKAAKSASGNSASASARDSVTPSAVANPGASAQVESSRQTTASGGAIENTAASRPSTSLNVGDTSTSGTDIGANPQEINSEGTGQGQNTAFTEDTVEAPRNRPAPSANTYVTDDEFADLKAEMAKLLNPGRLNSGIDPRIMYVGTRMAIYHIERGARRFVAVSKAIAADLGMTPADLRRYLRNWYNGARDAMEDDGASIEGMDSPDTVRALLASIDDWGSDVATAQTAPAPSAPTRTTPSQGAVAAPDANLPELARIFAEALRTRGFASITEARIFAREATGREFRPGTIEAKQLDEAIEAAVVFNARQIIADGGDPMATYRQLVSLYDRQPNLAVRTSTSVQEQAYSTPAPLAFLAARRAGIDASTTVYEPSAGNGMLLITADPAKVTANELNADRVAQLRALYPQATVTQGDATEATLPTLPNDRIIANPPFGPVKDEDGDTLIFELGQGYETREIDHAISMIALRTMKNDGKAALIVGSVAKTASNREDAYNAKAKREFYFRLYSEYNVTDHFTVSGDLYKKQGAAWPVDVIVIEGRGKSSLPLPAVKAPRIFDSWDALETALAQPAQVSREAGSADSGPARAGTGTGTGNVDAGASSSGGRPAAGQRDGETQQPGDVRGGPVDGEPGRTGLGEREAGSGAVAPAPGQVREPGRDRQRTATQPRLEQGEAAPAQVRYVPASGSYSLDTLVPFNMQTAAQAALSKIEDKHGSIDAYVADKLGFTRDEMGKRLSAEATDAIGLALDNMEKGAAFIIGDQTGIGKGRVVASVLRYAMKEGRPAIFVTEKPNLYADIYRDMVDVGVPDMLGREPILLMTNAGQTIDLGKGKELKSGPAASHNKKLERAARGDEKFDLLMTTYNQMQTVKGETTVRQMVLERMSEGAIIVFDESHNAGGQGPNERRDKKAEKGELAPNRAEFARMLARKAQGVMFSSATYAKRPEVMDLYARTDMGLAVADPQDLGAAIANGGVPLQQVIASALAEAGQYVRRERTWEGVEYRTPRVPVDEATYGNVTQILASIRNFEDSYVTPTLEELAKDIRAEAAAIGYDGSMGKPGVGSTNFTAVMHNIISQMLFALKAGPAADRALEALRRDRKPVITLANTMGSFIQSYAEEQGLKNGDPINLDFAAVFERYLDRTRQYTVKKPYSKEKGEKRYLSDRDLGPDAVADFRRIQALIRSTGLGDLPISPIDFITQRLKDEGYKVGEITGRSHTIDYSGGTPTLKLRGPKDTGIAGRQAAVNGFNSGKIDAMILNQSGSTGLSIHASDQFKDQRPRTMIIAQAELNVDTHMQMLGRIHRTGQVVLPDYDQLVADVPAEMRPAAVLAKKMASLNANTTGARDSAVTAEDIPDFMNEFGDEVIARMMEEDYDFYRRLDEPLGESDKGGYKREDAARKVTGRLMLLPLQEQRDFYDAFLDQYQSYLAQKEAAGEAGLEAKTLPLDAKVVSEQVVIAPTRAGTPFGDAVVQEVLDVKRLGKPFSSQQVLERISETLGEDVTNLDTALQRGRVWMRDNVTEQARADFEVYRMSAIDNASEKAVDGIRSRLMENQTFFSELTRVAVPGQGVLLYNENDDTIGGVVLGVDQRGKAKNPLALSTWQVTIATADSSRQLVIPFSQLRAGQMPTDAGRLLQPTSRIEGYPVLEAFDNMQAEAREKRVMFTGNILAAYKETNGKGQIVNFVGEDGSVRPGIMMRRGYNHANATKSRPVDFRLPEQVIEWLNRGKLVMGEAVSVTLEAGQVKVTAAAAKARGGGIFLNRNIINAIGSDFVKTSTGMVARAPQSRMRQVVEALMQNGAKLQAKTDLSEARDLVAQSGEALDSRPDMTATPEFKRWFAGSVVNDGAGNPIEVYHRTDAEFDAFDTVDFGSWFAENPETAMLYGDRGDGEPRMISAWLSAKKPLIIPESVDLSEMISVAESLEAINAANGTDIKPSRNWPADYEGNAAEWIGLDPFMVEEAKKRGFDSMLAYEQGERTWNVFEPEQIKSTGNRGTFNPDSPNMLDSRPDGADLFDAPQQPERTMTQAQRAELEARQKQQMARRGGQQGLGDQAGGLFSSERDQGSLFLVSEQTGQPITPKQANDLEADLRARLDAMGLQRVQLRVGTRETLARPGATRGPDGQYVPSMKLIRVAADAINGSTFTLSHEAVHALRDLGAFSQSDWTLLERAAWGRADIQASVKARYSDLPLEAQKEEAVADYFGEWQRDVENYPTVTAIARTLRRVLGIFEAIRNALRGRGFTVGRGAMDVVEDVRSGRTARDIGRFETGNAVNKRRDSRADVTATPEFKRWFGNSKVVDERGSPKVMYHGTQARLFDAFDMGNSEVGAQFFTENPDHAAFFAGFGSQRKGGRVIEVYLSVQNPLVVTQTELEDMLTDEDVDNGVIPRDIIPDLIERARREGYDGLMIEDFADAGQESTVVLPLRPEQIKSVDNGGNFNPDSPNMLDSRPAVALVQALSAPGAQTWKGKGAAAFDKFRTAMQDRYLPMLRTQRQIETLTGQALPNSMNPYLGEELMTGRIGSRLEKLHEDMVGPLFDDMARSKIDVEELETFLYARHAPERNARMAEINPNIAQGEGSGMTDIEAAAVMARIQKAGKMADMERLAGKVDAMRDMALAFRVETGLMSQKQADAWRGTYEYYVPLRGFAEVGGEISEETADRINRSGGGINVRGPESKRAFGRRSKADSPLAYMILLTEEAIVRGETNRVAQRFVNLARANPDEEFWQVNKVSNNRRMNAESGQVEEYVSYNLAAADKDWTVVAKFDGKEVRVTMNRANPAARRLADSMRNLTQHQMDWVTRYLGSVNRFLSAANTSYNPEFVITNAFRDLQTAAINLQGVDVPGITAAAAKHYKGALVAAVKGSWGKGSGEWKQWYDEFILSGGRVYFNQVESVEAIKGRVQSSFDLASARAGNPSTARVHAKRGFLAVRDAIENTNLGVENAVRLAAYRAAREAGVDKDKAASIAKNLTVNFNRRGTFGPVMNAAYLFYNAAVQGSVVILRSAKHPKVQKVLAGIVVAGAMNELLNMMLSDDDDDGESFYDKIPAFEKSRNMIFMLPGGSEYIKIPLPYGYGAFWEAGRTVSEISRRGGDRWLESTGHLVKTIVDSFNPVGGTDSLLNFVSPTIIDPIVDLTLNKDFTGRPIMPKDNPFDVDEPDAQRYFGSVGPHWRAVTDFLTGVTGGSEVEAGAIDVSPETLEHLAGVVFGAAGAFVDRVAGVPGKAISGDLEVNDVPFARKVVGGEAAWLDTTRYYDRVGEVEQAYEYTKRYIENENIEEGRAYAERKAKVLTLVPAMKEAQKLMREVREEKRTIDFEYEQDRLTDEQYKARRERVREVEGRIVTAFNTRWNANVYGEGE